MMDQSDMTPKWQPIETAPRDGTNILVWGKGFKYPEVVVWLKYEKEDAEFSEIGGYWVYSDDLLHDISGGCVDENWTHWRYEYGPDYYMQEDAT